MPIAFQAEHEDAADRFNKALEEKRRREGRPIASEQLPQKIITHVSTRTLLREKVVVASAVGSLLAITGITIASAIFAVFKDRSHDDNETENRREDRSERRFT